ncbi:hypothetical protein QFZ37_003511 [Chryseobacterium ginsenosidimutans]|uniref:TonB-dependent receptor plug domain-containing protein n=1 Tax=Chryseobacterium ginsenosidimutans TaxID=687846 RepID=UPI002782053E|nr:TonB-dependent receptor plug domain-containing protein [Chryseobacterium ginsenosidimutans]MDQ0595142.1 hypothetical protein [Chryseobacterium ginsenosidimutans]
MEHNNDIDKKFNEASKDLEEPATFPGFDKVWAKVEEKLDKKEEKKRKSIPVWLPYGIAASLLIGSGIFYFNKKENVEITKPVVAQNNVIPQKNTVTAVPEHIQKVDSMVKANIQNEILPQSPMNIAYQTVPNVYASPLSSPVDEMIASPSSHEDAAPALEGRIMDTLKRQNIEEVIAMGIKKEKSSMVNPLASSTRKKMYDLNAVADTAEATYPSTVLDLKEQVKEPEILAYNKGYIKTNKPIAANSGLGNRIGEKSDVNLIRGFVPGVNINSVSGTPGSGKVDISISLRGSLKQDNSPLVVIDGLTSDLETLRKLDPKKIDAISVLKGEKATSIFSGEKAQNGVLVVVTKYISKKEKRRLKKLLKNDLPKK